MTTIQFVCTILGGVSFTIVIIAFWEKAWCELKRLKRR